LNVILGNRIIKNGMTIEKLKTWNTLPKNRINAQILKWFSLNIHVFTNILYV
jgi:hypothetical protein